MKKFFPLAPAPRAPAPVEKRQDKRGPPAEAVPAVAVVAEPAERKRAKRQPLSVSEKLRARAVMYSDEELFREQSLVVRAGDGALFCKACGVVVNCKKRWNVEQHC